MAEKILVSTEEITTAVNAYTSAKDTMMTAIENMKSAVTTLDATWDGMASEAFFVTFNLLYSNMKTSEGAMNDAITELNNAIQIYSAEGEDPIKAQMQSLDAGDALNY